MSKDKPVTILPDGGRGCSCPRICPRYATKERPIAIDCKSPVAMPLPRLVRQQVEAIGGLQASVSVAAKQPPLRSNVPPPDRSSCDRRPVC